MPRDPAMKKYGAIRTFHKLCEQFKDMNVAGALTDQEQMVLTKTFQDLAKALGTKCPNMVPRKEKR